MKISGSMRVTVENMQQGKAPRGATSINNSTMTALKERGLVSWTATKGGAPWIGSWALTAAGKKFDTKMKPVS